MWNKTVSYLCKLIPGTLREWLICILIGVLIYQSIALPHYILPSIEGRLNRVEQGFHQTNGKVQSLLGQAGTLVKNVNDYYTFNWTEFQAQAATTTEILMAAYNFVFDLRVHMFGGQDSQNQKTTGLITETRGLISDSRELVQGMQKDLHMVMKTANDDLKTLDKALNNVASLVNTLETEIKSGSPEARKTVVALTNAINDLDALLANKDIAKTLANVQESTKSVDIALRPWRERAHALKVIFSKLCGMVKLVWAF